MRQRSSQPRRRSCALGNHLRNLSASQQRPCSRSSEARNVSVRAAEPAHLETLAQTHARAIKHHPAIGRGDAQFLADFVGLQPHDLAHVERARDLRRHLLAALVEHLPEALVLQRALRIAPGLREGVPVVGALLVEVAGRRTLRPTRRPRRRSSGASRDCLRNTSMILCLRMPVSQVRREDLPEKRSGLSTAASSVSWTTSSARLASRRCSSA